MNVKLYKISHQNNIIIIIIIYLIFDLELNLYRNYILLIYYVDIISSIYLQANFIINQNIHLYIYIYLLI